MAIYLSLISVLIINFHLVLGQYLSVLSPHSLRTLFPNGRIQVDLANFGYIPYGQTLIGNLLLTDPADSCGPLKPLHGDFNEPSPIVLVDRGNCSFVKKAFYSQLIGSKLCVIVDNKEEDLNEIVLVDDGFGYNIHIPTVMIPKSQGNILKNYLNEQNATTVTISMQFEIKKNYDKVYVEIWTSSFERTTYDFIKDFSSHHAKISNYVEFIPHFALWFCVYCKQNNYTAENNMCVAGGRYCAPNSVSANVYGQDIVLEDLRQLCIYKLNPSIWWHYASTFGEMCLNTTNLLKCSESVMVAVSISPKNVDECVKGSFDGSDMNKDDNSILREERQRFVKRGIQNWPTLMINNATYRGYLNPPTAVFDAICTAFELQPEACLTGSKENIVVEKNLTDHPVVIVLIIVIIVAIVMIFLLYLYKKVLKKDMDKELTLQVNSAISQYFALGDRSFRSPGPEKPAEQSNASNA